jgi:prepilin-type N-terminal cleavage/methylation domain-containing protein
MLKKNRALQTNILFHLKADKNYQSALRLNQGFTLVELLVAAALITIVVSITGVGIVAMLNKNVTADSEIERRTNLNRALDYIANEVRMSSNVSGTTTSSLPTGATGVLRLTIPSDSTYPNREYYLRPIYSTCTGNTTTSLWTSPNIICRRQIASDGTTVDSMLVDGVINSGFTAAVTSNRQAALTLRGSTTGNTLQVNTTAVARAK